MAYSASTDDLRWNRLLRWLDGLGMDTSRLPVERKFISGKGHALVLLTSHPASTQLFSIPPKALMNQKTLLPHYSAKCNARSLTAIQLLSLHLYLHRPLEDGHSSDPLFGPYMSTLPQEFDAHPLTWHIKRDQQDNSALDLLEALPRSSLLRVQDTSAKFYADWLAVQPFLAANQCSDCSSAGDTPQNVLNFLWAWLNVNTRCIYYRLKDLPSDADNVTLCPILDFANHTNGATHMSVATSTSHIRAGMTILSPKTASFAGDELCLKYGHHSNETLFVEYGFVNDFDPSTTECEEMDFVLDIRPRIVDMLETLGTSLSLQIRETLKDEGYWGDWTLHTFPPPAHPSYRVISTLRLCALALATEGSSELNLRVWRSVILGRQESISPENEQHWRELLGSICEGVIEQAGPHLRESPVEGSGHWKAWMWGNIRLLWAEELLVATAVVDSLAASEQF